MSDQSPPQWQPISALPLLASMIDSMLADSAEQHRLFLEVREKPHVLDDEIVNRAIRVYRDQIEDLRVYKGQLARWRKEPLTGAQRQEVKRLAGQLPRIRELSEAILALLEEIRKGTINRILEKSDEELGREVIRKEARRSLTEEQRLLAKRIDGYVKGVLKRGGGDPDILQGMNDYMGTFKQLVDMSTPEQMDLLCASYDGFHRFAKLLEDLARGIADGSIRVPK